MATLKQEIAIWGEALEAYEAENYQLALAKFSVIAETSRIDFNVGLIHATLGQHEVAVPHFQMACEKDSFMAVGFFQLGVSYFLLGQFEEALRAFEEANVTMRGNKTIDYEQIGLKFRLYSCEILFNKGLCMIYMGREQDGMRLLDDASRDKQTDEHGVIDEARRDQGAGYNVFSIPAGVLYRPPASKLRNLQAKNYLGQARLVAATDPQDAFIGFTGVTKARMQQNQYQSARFGPVSTGLDPLPEKGVAPQRTGITRSASASAGSVAGPNLPKQTTSVASNLRRRPSDYSAALTPAKPPPVPPMPTMPEEKPSAPFQPTGPLQRKPSDAKMNFKPDMSGPRPLPTPPESENYEPGFAEELLQSYARESKAPTPAGGALQEFEPPSLQDRTPMGQPKDRIAEWAAKASNAVAPPASPTSDYPQTPAARASSVRRPQMGAVAEEAPPMPAMKPLNIPGKAGGGATLRRSPTVAPSETINFGSSVTSWKDVERVRVKLHCGSTIRGMIISPDVPYEDMMDLVCRKLGRESVNMQFEDSEKSRIDIMDEGDWDAALDAARELAGGRPDAKLSIHVAT